MNGMHSQEASPGEAQELRQQQQQQALQQASPGAAQKLPLQLHQLAAQELRQQQPAVEEPQPAVEQEQQAIVHGPLPPPPLVARASYRTARPRARHR